MEKEKRLIDAKDFDLRVSQKKMSEVFPNWKELPKEAQDAVCKHGEYIRMLLETQLTVDAVEVVRCKDCFADGCCSVQIDLDMGGDGYCSKGKRRTDNG